MLERKDTRETKEYSEIEKERLYRQADLYGINTKWKRIDTIEILVSEIIEKKQQEIIKKNLIK